VQLTATRVGSYTNNSVTPAETVGVYMPVDLAVSWNIGDPKAKGLLGDSRWVWTSAICSTSIRRT